MSRSIDVSLSQKQAQPRFTMSRWRRQATPYLFLFPFAILFAIFSIGPLLYAFYFSLYRERLIGGTTFVGFQNYADVLHDPAFWTGIQHMLLLGVVQVPIMLGLALIFALLLDSGHLYFRRLFRLGFYLPYAIPSVVAALIWGYLYGQNFGPFAQIAQNFHWPTPVFLANNTILASIGNIVTWQYTGYNMIILFAALQAVPPELYESARIDGAGDITIAWAIKIPLIRAALLLTTIFSIIGTLQLFNEPQILSTLAPTVIGNNFSPSLYAYNLSFGAQEYNYATAVSFVLGVIALTSSVIFMKITTRREKQA
jgi:multiple sugar transport system permease protein